MVLYYVRSDSIRDKGKHISQRGAAHSRQPPATGSLPLNRPATVEGSDWKGEGFGRCWTIDGCPNESDRQAGRRRNNTASITDIKTFEIQSGLVKSIFIRQLCAEGKQHPAGIITG